jgi:hypothetical protein
MGWRYRARLAAGTSDPGATAVRTLRAALRVVTVVFAVLVVLAVVGVFVAYAAARITG